MNRLGYDDGTQIEFVGGDLRHALFQKTQFKTQLPAPNIRKVLEELNKVLERKSFQYCSYLSQDKKEIIEDWAGLGVIGLCPNSEKLFCADAFRQALNLYPDLHPQALLKAQKGERISCADMNSYKTEIWNEMPTVANYIDTVFGKQVFRSLFLKVPKGRMFNWHHHKYFDSEQLASSQFIYHIPLQTSPKCKMLVESRDGGIDSQNYAVGEVWFLNHLLSHAVDNREGSNDRIHLLIQVDINFSEIYS